MPRTRTLGYWIPTSLLAFALLAGGLSGLFHADDMAASFMALGYPSYLLTLLGIWKILGAIAIMAPGFPRLKEWAYAGIVFDLTGAVWSHVAAGDPIGEALPAMVLATLAIVSWRLRPSSRVLGPFGTA